MASLEGSLGAIMRELLTDRLMPTDAIGQIEVVYNEIVDRLRDDASHQIHRPARSMRLQSIAQEMLLQSSTYHLLWCLYCNPSGLGTAGPLIPNSGGTRTLRQELVDLCACDPVLSRVANVTAWLESLAEDLSSAQAPRFSHHDGVWIETRQHAQPSIGSSSHSLYVTQLDPDAPLREDKPLHPDNQKSEERLGLRVWQLLRSGRVKEARELCLNCGQAWRSASLSGLGPYGGLPVGLAADLQDSELSVEEQEEQLACEIISGSSSGLREGYKRACATLASRLTPSLSHGGVRAQGHKLEAASYGLLSGDLGLVMGACQSWEDALWAHCRCWLESQLSKGPASQAPPPMRGEGLMEEGALRAVMRRCGVTSQPETYHAPVAAVSSFRVIFEALSLSQVTAIASSDKEPIRQAQKHLIQDHFNVLVAHLHQWLVASGERGGGGGGGGGEGEEGEGSGLGLLGLPSHRPRLLAFSSHLILVLEALLGAHFDNNNSSEGEGDGMDGEGRGLMFHQGRQMRDEVIASFISVLLSPDPSLDPNPSFSPNLALVPQYLVLLGQGLREALGHETLTLLNRDLVAALTGHIQKNGVGVGGGVDVPSWVPVDQRCSQMLEEMTSWFGACLLRQQKQLEDQGEGQGLSNHLSTTIRPDESRLLTNSFIHSTRTSTLHGPLSRSLSLRWLTYPLTLTLDEGSHGGGGEGDGVSWIQEPWAYLDLMSHACTLLSELAMGSCGLSLGGGGGLREVLGRGSSVGGHAILTLVLPSGLEEAAEKLAAQLREEASSGAEWMEVEAEEAVAKSTLACASELESFAYELSCWRVYYEVDHDLRGWEERVVGGGVGVDSVDNARCEGQFLLERMKALLTPQEGEGWLEGLLSSPSPPSDHEGWVHLDLVLTSCPNLPTQEGGSNQTYPTLKGAALYEAETQLRASLLQAASAQVPSRGGRGSGRGRQSAATKSGSVIVRVSGPNDNNDGGQGQGQGHGYLSVHMACPRDDPHSLERMLDLGSCLIMGGGVGGGARVEGLPPDLTLVSLGSMTSRWVRARLCRRCCLGRVLLRCFEMRRALVGRVEEGRLGGGGEEGEELVELVAGAIVDEAEGGVGRGGERQWGGLIDAVDPELVKQVLRLEAETVVAVMRMKEI